MYELIRRSAYLGLDFINEGLGLSCFCEPGDNALPELTEEGLQEIEQRPDDWYMGMM